MRLMPWFKKGGGRKSAPPSTMWGQGKTVTYEPGSEFLPEMEIASTLILHFLDSETVKNQLPFVYKAPSLWYFVIPIQMY